jgi:hypothetical protein
MTSRPRKIIAVRTSYLAEAKKIKHINIKQVNEKIEKMTKKKEREIEPDARVRGD